MRLLGAKTTIFRVEAPMRNIYSTLFLFDEEGVAIVSRNEYVGCGFNLLEDKDGP